MPQFEAILFDFDGVLADTEPLHCACWAEVLAPSGVVLEWEFYRQHCIGIADRDMVEMLAAQARPPRPWEDLWTRYPAKRELFRRRALAAPPFNAGLASFLERLHREYRLAVVSSSSSSELDPVLTAGGIRRHFDTLVGRESTPDRLKPAPDPYLLAAKRLGVRSALVVEDSEVGLASGRAAGFDVLEIDDVAGMPELVLRRLCEAR
jgi:HAD superfamily hydrolase (TIGR01509 family)